MLSAFYTQRPGAGEIMLDLFGDYRTNVALYPAFQRYFRERRPKLLAVWGRGDPIFVPAGAEAFRRDLPDAEIHLLDTGHFALETHAPEIAERIAAFVPRNVYAEKHRVGKNLPPADDDLRRVSAPSDLPRSA